MTTAIEPTTLPSFERDAATGLVKGTIYYRHPNGRIDWYRMINPAHIVFNRKFDETLVKLYGGPADKLVYADVIKEKEVANDHILILLMGFVELADFRGYTESFSDIKHVTPGQNVTCQCHITWIPNEEEPQGKTSDGEADATYENTGGFGYLAAIAGNRAFVRAVRRGLRIPILGFDEIATKDTAIPESAGGTPSAAQSGLPVSTLQKIANNHEVTFEAAQKAAQRHWDALQTDAQYTPVISGKPADWKKWEDISAGDCLTLIKLIRKKAKESKTEAKT